MSSLSVGRRAGTSPVAIGSGVLPRRLLEGGRLVFLKSTCHFSVTEHSTPSSERANNNIIIELFTVLRSVPFRMESRIDINCLQLLQYRTRTYWATSHLL